MHGYAARQPVEQMRVYDNFASFNDEQFIYFLDQFVMLHLIQVLSRELLKIIQPYLDRSCYQEKATILVSYSVFLVDTYCLILVALLYGLLGWLPVQPATLN